MPWPKEHKAETRARIVHAAAAAFREHGLEQVGVAEIMRRAELTHGGFYGHFASKDDLVAAVVAEAPAESEASLAALRGATSPGGALDEATAYLSPEHMAHPERGCLFAALGPELARGSRGVRRPLAAKIQQRLSRLAASLSSRLSPAVRRRRAAGTLACMVGGIVLARGLDEAEASAFLKDVRAFVRDALAEDD
jgi:TetR/AcrR family transcriptional regulator, transcriptional repressor for nem operon